MREASADQESDGCDRSGQLGTGTCVSRCDSPPAASIHRIAYGIVSSGCQAICSATGLPTT
jgi:hypothetical protein